MASIIPRKMDFPFNDDIPRHWMRGSAFGTAMANALNLVFPKGERFFVRSVRAYQERIQDPALLEAMKAFYGQEGHHAREHERFFDLLRRQGQPIDRWLAIYERIGYGFLERVTPPNYRLAATAALEHFTAMFAHEALTKDLLDEVHPVMRQLLRWHAAEEIEHKWVAFDVLKQVDPRYRVRVGGLLLATLGLLGFWFGGAVYLLRHDPEASLARIAQEMRAAVQAGQLADGDIARAFVRYLDPRFHPNQVDDYALAQGFLESIGRAAA